MRIPAETLRDHVGARVEIEECADAAEQRQVRPDGPPFSLFGMALTAAALLPGFKWF